MQEMLLACVLAALVVCSSAQMTGSSGQFHLEGATFINWGRTVCPGTSKLIYQGIAMGSYFGHTGSGTNMQCLPLAPEYEEGSFSRSNNAEGLLYVVEYATLGQGIPSFAKLDGNDVPCAVCERENKLSKTLVQAGSPRCPAGFKVDYDGYLMAPSINDNRGNYICVDRNAEGYGTSDANNAHRLYPVETDTSGGLIQGYTSFYEVTCAVCGSDTSGAVYTRWGKTSCPANHKAIFDGRMAGSRADVSGGGADFHCLVKIPVYGEYDANNNNGAKIYRVEFQTDRGMGTFFTTLQNKEAPCVVCQAPDAQQYSVVVPGAKTCPDGYNLDYNGYVMATHYLQRRTDFVCVDSAPDNLGSVSSVSRGLLYFTEMTGGTGAVGGYTQFLELACAHCTSSGNGFGSAYTRYGVQTCPDGHKLLWKSMTSGSHYTHSGSGTDLLCLNAVPEYLTTSSLDNGGARLYHGEFETSVSGNPTLVLLHNGDIGCAVCQRPVARTSAFMFPGKLSCPSGFTKDFGGYLLSPHYMHWGGNYICTDQLSTPMGSLLNDDGMIIYSVEFQSDSQVPNYVNFLEIPCTMCSGAVAPPPPPPPVDYSSGPVYVRWGRTSCPSSAKLVYQGYAAGSYYDHGGNGANLQCMPLDKDVQYEEGFYNAADNGQGMIFRVEYRTLDQGIDALKGLHFKEVPCAVCKRLTLKSKSLMVPGTLDCPANFNIDYRGYLFSTHTAHSKGETVCIDRDAEGVGSSNNEVLHLLYPVESVGVQGYTDFYEVTCVQCSSVDSGSVYVQWGRTKCTAANTNTIYTGQVAGPHYQHRGGGVNPLCLFPIPKYNQYSGTSNSGAKIYRSEYETFNWRTMDANFGNLQNYEVPCSVCQTASSLEYSIMVPGNPTCPPGYSLNYRGYIMGQHYSFPRTEAVCMDEVPEGIGSSGDENGNLFYLSQISGGGFFGYPQFLEVTCAHCSTSGGSAYTRWGRTVCPDGDTQLWTGQSTGSHYTHGGTNSYLCLHPVPSFLKTQSTDDGGLLFYRTEYEFSFPGNALQNYELACSICQRPKATSYELIIPARMDCPTGYTLNYKGFLVTEHYIHPKTRFECLDHDPTAVGQVDNQDGALIYQTEFKWNTSPRPDNVLINRELTCTVCTGYESGLAPTPPPPPPPPIAQGETFVRWGRTTCPSNSVMVYVGVGAGAHYTHSGSGNNLQCLALDPQYKEGEYSRAANTGGILYRAEFRTKGRGITSFDPMDGSELVCVVCQRIAADSKGMMVPGTYNCPAGFNVDYSGYLFATHSTHFRSETICVDRNPERYGSIGLEDYHLLYPVETASGGGAIQGYTQFQEVTCSVCGSKAAGAVYTRWGRQNACPVGHSVVYTGFVAGPFYTNPGGGGNQLCMFPAPDYLEFNAANNGNFIIYKTEYETASGAALSGLQNFDAPCTVCQASNTELYSHIVYGRPDCPNGFNINYRGYVMAPHNTHYRMDAVCVDENAQGVGSSGDENGNLWYFSEFNAPGYAGYNQYQEVACAVCTSQSGGGSTYTRYGRTKCADGDSSLYVGRLVGSNSLGGGTSSLMCFHPQPSFLLFNSQASTVGYLYRSQYATSDAGVNYFKPSNLYDVPCTVCQRKAAQSIELVVPGRNTCPGAFGLTYRGFLFSEYYANGKSKYICMDRDAEPVGSGSDEAAANLFLVEAQDATYPPNTYIAGYEINCAVCAACGGTSYQSNGQCVPFTLCQQGQYQSGSPTTTSDRVCSSCPSGSFQSSANHALTSCSTCSSSSYQDLAGQSSCKACTDGYYRASASLQSICPIGSSCTSCAISTCPAGTFQDLEGQTSCKICSSITYQNLAGQSSCKNCDVGFYRISSTAQQACPAGTRCPGSCARENCPAGTFQDLSGQSACKSCPLDQFQDLDGQSSCKSCSLGYYRASPTTQAICPLGYACSLCARVLCDSGKYQDTQGATSCKTASPCGLGQYMSSAATSTSNTVCATCSSGFYQDQVSHFDLSCKTITNCAPGSYETKAPTLTSNRLCAACDGVSNYQDLTNQISCKPVSLCGPGTVQTRAPTSTTNRVCGSCTLDVDYMDALAHTFTTCKRLSDLCQAGSYQSSAPTISSDRVCKACPSGQFQNVANSVTCKPVTVCSPGTYESVAPTSSTDRQCSQCAANTFQDLSGQTSCKNVTVCTKLQYITKEYTPSSDRTCGTCTTSCSAGFYLTGTCGGSAGLDNPTCRACHPSCATCNGPDATNCISCAGDLKLVGSSCLSGCIAGQYADSTGACKACDASCYLCDGPLNSNCIACRGLLYLYQGKCLSTCPVGTFMKALTNDNRCVACSVCGGGTWSSTTCSGSQDTICTAWSSCKVGEKELQPPTSVSDRICTSCILGVEYQPIAAQTSCKKATVCQAGTYVSTQPTITSDRVCKSCLAGNYQDQTNQNACLPCLAGRFQSLDGQADCVDCGSSKYQPLQGQTSCLLIQPGFYGSGGGITTLTGQTACDKGFYCLGGSNPRASCTLGSDFQDATQQTSCKPVSRCSAGAYESRPPSTSADRVCTSCPLGTYQDAASHVETRCKDFTVCYAGTFEITAPTATSDRRCNPCDGIKGYSDVAGLTSCKTITTCLAGSFVSRTPTASSDRLCTACVAGSTYSTANNAPSCTPVTDCLPGTRVSQLPSESRDRLCANCDGVTNYQNLRNQDLCKGVTMCLAGERQTIPPSASTDRVCGPCPSGTFMSSASHAQTDCTAWTECAMGTFVSRNGTSTSDRICSPCDIGKTFQDLKSQTSCKTVSLCAKGQFEAVPPTLTSNRVCNPCTLGSTFQDQDQHSFPQCKLVSGVCQPGSREAAAPTVTSDRVCAPCDGINFYQDQPDAKFCKTVTPCTNTSYISVVSSPTRDQVCKTCTVALDCAENQFLTGTCGGLSNRECRACHPTCKTCKGETSSDCLSCPLGLKLSEGKCLSDCGVGKYDDGTGKCFACSSTCYTCNGGTSSSCVSCTGSLYLFQSQCGANCPVSTYKLTQSNDNRCAPCTVCTNGTFSSVACSPSNDTVCKPWTLCDIGQEQSIAPNSTFDRVCVACDGITKYQDQRGQINCKSVSKCVFPDKESLPPAPSRDRTCTCDRTTCGSLVTKAYQDVLCTKPDDATLKILTDDCCAGQTDDVLRQLLRVSQAYSLRHECPGCTSTCSCLAGYYEAATSLGTVCRACDGKLEFSSSPGATRCTAVSTCALGEQEKTAPSSTSDRICEKCPVGTIDHDNNGATKCVSCTKGTYVPSGSFGTCDNFLCPAGSADVDSDPRTACEKCKDGETFQPSPGNTTCIPVTVCGVGEEEILIPSALRDRICRQCRVGVTFKSVVGQSVPCRDVKSCAAGEEETSVPTISADRVCTPCRTGSTYKPLAGQVSKCQNVTSCKIGEEEQRVPTLTSDRVCIACELGQTYKAEVGESTRCVSATQCTRDTYEKTAPTLSTNRVCAPLTTCTAGQFESKSPSATSDRICTACSECPASRFKLSSCSATRDTVCDGCTPCTLGSTWQSRGCTAEQNAICIDCKRCDEKISFQRTPCNLYNDTVCQSLTFCDFDEYETRAPTSTSDRICAKLTRCLDDEFESVPPTRSSNRVCRKVTVCKPGQEEAKAPGASSDRICRDCVPGTTDSDFSGSTPCVACSPGSYTPQGAQGRCSSYICPAGSADQDNDPSTPCTQCEYGVSFAGRAGMVFCDLVQNCSSGAMEIVPPTLFANRICVRCITGLTFKPLPGQQTQCEPVRMCRLGVDFEVRAPTESSDRECKPVSVCSSSSYEIRSPTLSTDRECRPLTVCEQGEFEFVVATATSDRKCKLLRECTSDEYEDKAPTRTSDRVCLKKTVCTSSQFEKVRATATSDRLCVTVSPLRLFFYEDYHVFLPSDPDVLLFKNELSKILARSVDDGASRLVNVEILAQGSRSRRALTANGNAIQADLLLADDDARLQISNAAFRGDIVVLNISAVNCPFGTYQTEPATLKTAPICSTYQQCFKGLQYEAFPGNTTHNRECKLYTICSSGDIESKTPTLTSDRVCTKSSASSSGGLAAGTTVLAAMAALIVIILVLVLGFVYYRRKVKERKRENMLAIERSGANTLTSESGLMLRQLSLGQGVHFDNPLFQSNNTLLYGSNTGKEASPVWLKGRLSREEAEQVLTDRPSGITPGDFLVRESTANNCHVLSMVNSFGRFEHHRLQPDARFCYQMNGQIFSKQLRSLPEVVQHLSCHKECGTDIFLNMQYAGGSSSMVTASESSSDDIYGPKVTAKPEQELYGPKLKATPEWLKLGMSRKEAEAYLKDKYKNVVGAYLVRDSRGQYALSVQLPKNDCEHHTLAEENGLFSLNGSILRPPCRTIEDAVVHLQSHQETMSVPLANIYATMPSTGSSAPPPRPGKKPQYSEMTQVISFTQSKPEYAYASQTTDVNNRAVISNPGYAQAKNRVPEEPAYDYALPSGVTNPMYLERAFEDSNAYEDGYLDVSADPNYENGFMFQ